MTTKKSAILSFLFVLLFVATPSAHGVPVPRLFGEQPRDGFIKNYFSRLYEWHANSLHTFLSAEERSVITDWSAVVRRWGYTIDTSQIYPYFYFSHTLNNGHMDKPSLRIALAEWPMPLREKLLRTLSKRKISLKADLTRSLFGVTWHSQTQTVEVIYLHTAEKPLALSHLDIEIKNDPLLYEQRLYSETFDKNGKKILSHLTSALKTVNWQQLPTASLDALSVQKIESSAGDIQWKMDLRSLEPTLLPPATEQVSKALSKIFLLAPDSLIYKDFNNHTLFYP